MGVLCSTLLEPRSLHFGGAKHFRMVAYVPRSSAASALDRSTGCATLMRYRSAAS